MPKCRAWDPSQPGPPVAGVGNDLVYRDPWGNPYVISMDLNYDEQCQDAFYCLTMVSSPNPPGNPTSGLNGLINPDGTPLKLSVSRQGHGLVRRAGWTN